MSGLYGPGLPASCPGSALLMDSGGGADGQRGGKKGRQEQRKRGHGKRAQKAGGRRAGSWERMESGGR